MLVILSLLLSMASTNTYSQSFRIGYKKGGIRTVDAMRMAHHAHKLKKQRRMAKLNDGKIRPGEKMRIMKRRDALKRSMVHSYMHRKRARLSFAIKL